MSSKSIEMRHGVLGKKYKTS